jgi:hypothetical protein
MTTEDTAGGNKIIIACQNAATALLHALLLRLVFTGDGNMLVQNAIKTARNKRQSFMDLADKVRSAATSSFTNQEDALCREGQRVSTFLIEQGYPLVGRMHIVELSLRTLIVAGLEDDEVPLSYRELASVVDLEAREGKMAKVGTVFISDPEVADFLRDVDTTLDQAPELANRVAAQLSVCVQTDKLTDLLAKLERAVGNKTLSADARGQLERVYAALVAEQIGKATKLVEASGGFNGLLELFANDFKIIGEPAVAAALRALAEID